MGLFPKLKKEQLENIQIDYGIVIINYGEEGARRLGPIRGGAEFTAHAEIRDIEHDEALGDTVDMQYIDRITANLKFAVLDASLENLALTMPQADFDATNNIIKNNKGGIIPTGKYLKNITLFAKVVKGGYKKITLYNAINKADLVWNTAPKAEGAIPMDMHAAFNHEDETNQLYDIQDINEVPAA